MFLTRRAVSLLVCDAGAFGQRGSGASKDEQLQQDIRKLEELRVCDWLRSLSFRIPDSDVILVATKCDLADGKAADTAGRIENASRCWLEDWARNFDSKAVRVEDDVSLTSCSSCLPLGMAIDDGEGDNSRNRKRKKTWQCDWRDATQGKPPTSLLDRVIYKDNVLRNPAMVLPRSWDIALTFLEDLGSGRQVTGLRLSPTE